MPGHIEIHLSRRTAVRLLGAALLAVAAGAMILLPSLVNRPHAQIRTNLASEVSTIDPRSLVPVAGDLPAGTRIQSHGYVSTQQAAQRNGTSLALLQRTGREIGFDRDFLVPGYGDVEVEVVRFRTHVGMARAYSYFLTLPVSRGLPTPMRTEGMGERAGLVITSDAQFLEFMRGRYYVVVTSVPAGGKNLNLIGRLSTAVDRRIRTYRLSA